MVTVRGVPEGLALASSPVPALAAAYAVAAQAITAAGRVAVDAEIEVRFCPASGDGRWR